VPLQSRSPRRRRCDAADFVLGPDLVNAIRKSRLSLTALGFPHGIPQSHLSTLLRGQRFGTRVRAKVISLGAALGISAERCAKEVHSA
jgi:hypothetical protein